MATHFYFKKTNQINSKASHHVYSFTNYGHNSTVVALSTKTYSDNNKAPTFNSIPLLSSRESRQLRRQIHLENGHNQIKFIRDQFTKNMAFTQPIQLEYGVSTLNIKKKSTLFTRI